MRISLNTSKWYDPVWAAFIFFTRLPLWRMHEPPRESYRAVVEFWPLTGWLTGAVTAAVIYFGSFVFPYAIAVIMALAARVLLTGALHEDGLADFFDGFGGGTSRERTLAIMKDSRIGSYGVIGLILYFLLLIQAASLPLTILCTVTFCADCWSKACASQLINQFPYARKEEESKAHVVYNRMTLAETCMALFAGALPLLLLPVSLWIAAFFPVLVFIGLCQLMKQRLQGYTGDCCGATFLLCELSFYMGALMLYDINY